MSDYGVFEASTTDGHEEEQKQRQAQRDLGRAIEAAREGFGDFLGAATDKDDYTDRLALVMNDLMQKVADSGVMPVPGVMRKVKAALRPQFRKAVNEEALEWAENYYQRNKTGDGVDTWKDALGLAGDEFGTNFSAEDYARHSSRKQADNFGEDWLYVDFLDWARRVKNQPPTRELLYEYLDSGEVNVDKSGDAFEYAISRLSSRKQARDTWDDWVDRMKQEEADGTGYGSVPGWTVDIPGESPGDEDIDNPDPENPGRHSSLRHADDYIKGDALNFINHLQNGGYRMPKDAGYPGEGGQMDDELYDYTNGDQNRISEITRFLQENWDFYAYGASRTAKSSKDVAYEFYKQLSEVGFTGEELADPNFDWDQDWVKDALGDAAYTLGISEDEVLDSVGEFSPTSSGFFASRKQASDIDLDDMRVLNFFYQFEDEGLEPSAPGDEQWEWVKSNVDYDVLQDKIDQAYEYGELSRSDADSMAYELQQTFFGSRTAGAGNWSQTHDGSNEWVLNGNPQISIFEEEDGYYLFNNISLVEVFDTFEQAMELAESRYEGSRKVALDWSTVQEKVEQSGWDPMYADYIAWALDNGKNVEDTYSFVDYSDLLGLDAEDEQLLKKFIQNTAPKLYGSRKTADLSEVLEDYDVLSFFWDTFEEKGLDTTPSGAEQWEWLKNNLSKEEIEEGIDFILGVGEFISQEQADALRTDLRTGSRKTAGLEWDTEEENYWSYTSPDSGLDYWIKKDPADYNNYYGGFAWSVFDYLAGEGDRGNAQSFDEAEQNIENFIDSQSPNAALDYLGSRKTASKCPKCDGMGRETYEKENGSLSTQTCKACGGTGTTKESRRKEALDIDGKWEEELPGIGYASCTPKAGGGFELYMWSDTMQSEALDVVGTSEEARRVWQEWRRSDIGPSNAFNTDDNYFLGHVKHAGGTDFATFAEGSSAQEAFNNAKAEAKRMYGDDGYTGSIAEKDSFEMASRTPMTEEEARKFIWNGDGFGKFDDKWGPAGCIELDTGGFVFFGIAST